MRDVQSRLSGTGALPQTGRLHSSTIRDSQPRDDAARGTSTSCKHCPTLFNHFRVADIEPWPYLAFRLLTTTPLCINTQTDLLVDICSMHLGALPKTREHGKLNVSIYLVIDELLHLAAPAM